MFGLLIAVAGPNMADSPREMRDKTNAKKQAFLDRLPLTSLCKAEQAGALVRDLSLDCPNNEARPASS
jgi:hypothetical protein